MTVTGLVIGKGYPPPQVRGEGGGVGVLRSHYAHQKISMVDVRDVAAVAAALLLDAGECVAVCVCVCVYMYMSVCVCIYTQRFSRCCSTHVGGW